MKARLPAVRTRVGRAEDGDNRFRGFSVDRDLAGQRTLVQTLVLALTGRTIDAEASAVIDDLSASILAADPRIWPLRIARLGATHGSTLAGAASALLAQESTSVGGGSSAAVAHYFAQTAAELGANLDDDVALSAIVARDFSAGHKFVGYGVPFRDTDERVTTAERCLRARGRAFPHFRLARRIETALAKHRPAPLNAAGAIAAALLDLGFSPREVPTVVIFLSTPSLYANAVEGAEQKAAVLQRLPDECVEYKGPPPRRSPRFREPK